MVVLAQSIPLDLKVILNLLFFSCSLMVTAL